MKIGIDLVEHKDIINKDERFIKRVLSSEELAYYETLNSEKRKLEYLASRWALKEAIIKCYEHFIDYSKIAILNKKNGAPYALINNKAVELQISLSHTDNYSIAIAILLTNDDDLV